tara:strand:+ start:185 stop:910 length:726 start_codon:yes stop_codon:yes gene_type:complete
MLSQKMSGLKIKGFSYKKNNSSCKGKTNFKHKKRVFDDCCICFNSVEKLMDNMITCGKTNHTICGDCKVKMKGQNCPMCRSHPVKLPIAQDVNLKIIKKNKKEYNKTYEPQIQNPKKRRNYKRNNPYDEPFGRNTNRIKRQRYKYNNINGDLVMLPNPNFSYYDYTSLTWVNTRLADRRTNTDNEWISDQLVLRYNGGMITEYDSASDTTEDTLSLITDVNDVETLTEDVIDYVSRINNID